jgi:glycosyltransferase involved in cell wall biosynthesis
MKISVITVCKNAKDTIKKTIDSILSQTCPEYEIVVIDGGSDDGTLDILEQYGDKINLTSEPDNGIYDAMNKGLRKITGDIILFLNADDYLSSEDVFQVVADKYQSNPELGILWGNVSLVSQDKKTFQEEKYDYIKSSLDMACSNICHQAIFYKKELFEKYGYYDESFKVLADWDFNIRALVQEKTKCLYLDRVLVVFQLGGISSNSDKKIKKLKKKENKFLKQKYFGDLALFLNIDEFLSKYFGSAYKPIRKKLIGIFSISKLNFVN